MPPVGAVNMRIKSACEFYMEAFQEKHDNFSVADSGLVLSPDWPYLGVSPGGCVNLHVVVARK